MPSGTPGPRHWGIFTRLCDQVEARGNLVPDAYLVAIAIESGRSLATAELATPYRLRAADAVHLATTVQAGVDRFFTNDTKGFPKDITEVA